MTLRRDPATVWEQKVDFEKIGRSQTARQASMLGQLRDLLAKMQADTLRWVEINLVQKKLRTAVSKFSLSRTANYRAILRKRLTAATRRGVADVAGEVGQATPRMKTSDLTRVRARADALYDEHINRLESELKRVWSQAMFGNVDREQLRYVTRKAFADFAGWEQPKPPGG